MLPKKLSARISRNHSWAVNTLKKYSAIPSVSAQKQGIKESILFLEKLFRKCGLKVKIISARGRIPPKAGKTPGHPVVYAEKIVNPAARTILFYNHYDVQPAEPFNLWDTPPFSPAIRNGKIFGRGVADNKGNLIARLSAVKSFAEIGLSLPVNVKFLVDGEEEIGSPSLPSLIKKYRRLISADLCIWETGGKDESGRPKLILGCKGIMHLELSIQAARDDLHSSNGIIVPNPVWQLVWALNSLKDFRERILINGFYQDVRKTDRMDKIILRKIPFNEQEKLNKWGLKKFVLGLKGRALVEHFYYQPALNINGLSGGYQGPGHKTVLPKEASAKIDFRLVPDQNPADILKKLRCHLDKHGFVDVKINEARGYPPARTPVNHPYVKLVAEAQEKIYGRTPVIEPLFAASGPMYLFTPLMPCVCEGIGHPDCKAHAPNENIYLKDLRLGTKCIAGIIIKIGNAQ
ncbi:MAG: M20/M25/M40 family metallo-hydrolase [Planctomycetota bacterium]